MRINVLVLAYNIQMIQRPMNRGHEMWINVLVLAYNIQMIRRPTNRGHKSDSSEQRMAHNWRYWRFGFVDCEVRSYQWTNQLTIITLSNDKVSQLMTNRLSNEVDRIGRLNSRWMSNQRANEWMNDISCIRSRLYMLMLQSSGDRSRL